MTGRRERDSAVPAGIRESLSVGSPLFRSAAADRLHGIILLPDGPMLISAYPILQSDGSGTPAGTMIMGRFLRDDEVNALRNMSGISIAVYPYSATGMSGDFKLAEGLADSVNPVIVAPVDADTVSGYTIIDDIYGKPALVVRVDEPRIVYQQSQGTLLYIVVSLLISGLVFCIVTMFFLERMIVSRMIRLSEDVGKIGPDTSTAARVSVSGDDEVAELASTINRTLDALEASRRQLQDNEERLRSMVENINDVVWETDATLKLTYVSPKARNVFGYGPDELKGRSPFELVKPGEREHIRSIIHDMNVRKDSFAHVEFCIVRSNGASGMD